MRERLTDDPVAASTPLSLAAFSATVERRQAALYGFLHGLLGDAEQARDPGRRLALDDRSRR